MRARHLDALVVGGELGFTRGAAQPTTRAQILVVARARRSLGARALHAIQGQYRNDHVRPAT